MCSYFQQKIRLLTSVVVGIETFTVKKKTKPSVQQCKSTAWWDGEKHELLPSLMRATETTEKASTDHKGVLDQTLRKRLWVGKGG